MTTFELNSTEEPLKAKRTDENRPKRKRISPDQLQILTDMFEQTDTPNHDLREKIAQQLNMTNREVQVWFQNRRAKVNRLRQQSSFKVQPEDNKKMDKKVNSPALTMNANNNNNNQQKQVKFNYWSKTTTPKMATPPLTPPTCTAAAIAAASSSSSSSLLSSPILPSELVFHPNVTPIDILATAAAYVQQLDENERNLKKRKYEEEQQQQQQQTTVKKHKSWRPWL